MNSFHTPLSGIPPVRRTGGMPQSVKAEQNESVPFRLGLS